MILKNNDQIEEIKYLIPHVLNMYGVSEEQNEKVLKKTRKRDFFLKQRFLLCSFLK